MFPPSIFVVPPDTFHIVPDVVDVIIPPFTFVVPPDWLTIALAIVAVTVPPSIVKFPLLYIVGRPLPSSGICVAPIILAVPFIIHLPES